MNNKAWRTLQYYPYSGKTLGCQCHLQDGTLGDCSSHTQTQVRGPGCSSGLDKARKNDRLKRDSSKHLGLLWAFHENLALLWPGTGSEGPGMACSLSTNTYKHSGNTLPKKALATIPEATYHMTPRQELPTAFIL